MSDVARLLWSELWKGGAAGFLGSGWSAAELCHTRVVCHKKGNERKRGYLCRGRRMVLWLVVCAGALRLELPEMLERCEVGFAVKPARIFCVWMCLCCHKMLLFI